MKFTSPPFTPFGQKGDRVQDSAPPETGESYVERTGKGARSAVDAWVEQMQEMEVDDAVALWAEVTRMQDLERTLRLSVEPLLLGRLGQLNIEVRRP